jgi:alpha-1,6-mannosyltransferase
MIICDLSSFYCEKGGGVSTYHRARLDWFARQSLHKYVLISPGPRAQVRQIAPSATAVQVYGVRASRDPNRYRILTDYAGVRAALERFSPDVLETHDPWFSLPFGLVLRYRGPYRGLLATYCHSDPIRTYVTPRLNRWRWMAGPIERFERWADRELHRMHAGCHAVFVASEVMRERLQAVGVTQVVKMPFAVDPALLRVARRPAHRRVKRLLYAGRLDDDKEFGLVVDILPDLLRRSDVLVTVAGAGRHQGRVRRIAHPRFRYLGHITDRAAMRLVYASHDVLLAPGRFETFGLSALEGAAAGLLVVGPNAGGTGELLTEWRSPLVFDPGCADAFLDRVGAAIDVDPRPWIDRGRALAERYGTWPDAIARQVAVYESMLGHPAGERRSSGCPMRTTVPEEMWSHTASPPVASTMMVEP